LAIKKTPLELYGDRITKKEKGKINLKLFLGAVVAQWV
jgi:hypothetical protein